MRHGFVRSLAAGIIVLLASSHAPAATPSLVNYQGILTNVGGTPQVGTFTVTFAIYPVPAGGSVEWSESQSVTTNADGLFNVLLGTSTPLTYAVFSTSDAYLSITVSPDVSEMMPRTRIASVAYAFRPATVDGATGGTISGNTAIQSDLTVSGNVGVGTASPAAKLNVLNGQIQVGSQLGSAGIEFYPAAFGTPTNAGSISGVGGSPNAIAIMPVGNVGIGTTSPAAKLDVVGDLKVSGNIIGSTPWTAFPFAAGYDNYEDNHGGGYQTVQYRKIGDIVYLRGLIHQTDHAVFPLTVLVGTLPVGFRPPATVNFSTIESPGGILVGASGVVLSNGNPTEYQYLDGISFSTSP